MPTFFQQTRQQLQAFVAQRLPDNTAQLITPLALRTVLLALVESMWVTLTDRLPGPNRRPDLWKEYRWYSEDTPGFDGDGETLLAALEATPELFTLRTRMLVDFSPDGQARTYKFAYVEQDGQYQVPREAGGPLVHVNLVTEDAVTPPTGVTAFDNTRDYAATDRVLDEQAGVSLQFKAKVDMVAAQMPGGVVPTPEVADNPYWENLPLAAGSGAVARTLLGRGAYVSLRNENKLQAGTEYLILRQQEGERVPGQQPAMLPSVLVYATSGGSISPKAIFDPGAGGQNQDGFYDPVTDEFTLPGSEVRLGVPGQPDQFYASIDAAREARANDFLGMALFISSDQLLADGYYGLINMRSLRGNGATIRVSGDALVQLGGPRGFRIEPDLPFNPDSLQLSESIHDCVVSAGRIIGDVLSTDTQFVFPPGLIIEAGARLLLGPGTQLDLNYQVVVGGQAQRYFTDNGDGTYTTAQGGLVVDQRGGGPGAGGPAPDLSNYYTKAQADARFPVLDGSGKVAASQLPTTLVELNVVFPAAGAQAQELYISQARLVGMVALSSATSTLLNLSFKKNNAVVALPVAVVLGDKLTVSATADGAGGLVVLTVS